MPCGARRIELDPSRPADGVHRRASLDWPHSRDQDGFPGRESRGEAGGAVQPHVAMELMKRAITIAEDQWPEMADAHMEVPIDYFSNPDVATKERELFETTPLALVAGSEIADPNDYVVRNALGRSVLITRDEDGIAHAFLNYCRHRGAEPAQGCGNARRFTCPYHAWVYDTGGSRRHADAGPP